MVNELMAGADCTVPYKDIQTVIIFLKYGSGRNNDNILLILDGPKSQVAVDIIEWAHELNVIIHILPAHTYIIATCGWMLWTTAAHL